MLITVQKSKLCESKKKKKNYNKLWPTRARSNRLNHTQAHGPKREKHREKPEFNKSHSRGKFSPLPLAPTKTRQERRL